MSNLAYQPEYRYNWDDYRTWPDDQRWEIIDGVAYNMSPAPSTRHQQIAWELGGQMFPYFRGKQCKAFAAPTDVKLSEEDIVQPDLLVVCDPDQVRDTHIEGPPTLVVEILSPSTWRKDRQQKLELYERVGVKEYWVVTTYPGTVEVYTLDEEGAYQLHAILGRGDTLTSPAFPELRLALVDVFPEGRPPETSLDMREQASAYVPRPPPPKRG